MKKLCTSFLAMLVTCAAWSQTIPGVALQPVGSGFTAPTDLQNAGDERMFVVEKPGLIIAWNPGTGTKDTFLNITDRVLSAHMEQGLLGLAFDPDYANTGRFYVNYTALDSTGDSSGVSRISRFILSATDSNMADASSEEILLVQDQPFPNHNGGWIAFGPDGYLYFAIGDGGGAGDPQENAMNLGNLLGKVSRIDVSAASGYDIPGGNPFVGTAGAMPEIYHYGLRNPFRNSFDMLTGDLWIADVGQDMWEEINYVPAGTGGGLNFGWDCYEAFMPYEPTVDCPQDDSLTFPVYAYDHDPMTGDCSVAAGYVYRGSSITALYGHFVFSDFCSGRVRILSEDSAGWSAAELVNGDDMQHTTFGMDQNGELYIAQLNGDILMVVDTTCNPVAVILADDTIASCEPVLLQALEASDLVYRWYDANGAIADANGVDFTADQSGVYYVVVTDTACGESDTSDMVMLEITLLDYALVVTNNTCGDSLSGTATVDVFNATAPVSIAWSTGDTLATITGLASGTYAVTISDAAGCSAVDEAVIGTDAGFTVTAVATDAGCNDSTGNIILTIDGGVAPFMFMWSNGETTQDINDLTPGVYTVTVMDSTGCFAVVDAVVEPQPDIIVNIIGDTTLCPGDSTLLSTDAAGMMYLWSNGESTESILAMAGTYAVTVYNSGGCVIGMDSAVITTSELPTLTFTVTNASAGQNDGSIDLTVTGGDAPYAFVWSNGMTDEDMTNTAAGTYMVTVTTAAGCTAMDSVTVGEDGVATCSAPSNLMVSNITATSAHLMWNDVPGAIQYIVHYGPTADTSMWLTLGVGTNMVTLLALDSATAYQAHVYTVCADSSVSDSAMVMFVTEEDTATVCPAPTGLMVNNVTTTSVDVMWNTVPGAIQYIVHYGPVADTTMWLTLGVDTNTVTLFTLESGTAYGVHVFTVCADSSVSSMAMVTFTTTTTGGCALTVNVGTTNVTCYGLKNGSATVAVAGGTGPYTYAWSNGRTQSTLPKLKAGTYTVTVTDANGCTGVGTANISQPDAIQAYHVTTQTCPGECTGTSTAIVYAGGVAPFTFEWSNGETTATITGLCAGVYWVTITDASGCEKIVGAHVSANPNACDAVRLAVDNDATTFGLYPNPADVNVNLVLPVYEGTADVMVYNAMGQRVIATTVESVSSASLDVRRLPSGIYHVQFVNNGLVRTAKFVKQ